MRRRTQRRCAPRAHSIRDGADWWRMAESTRFELADVGRLGRRAIRAFVRSARKPEVPAGPETVISSHLGCDGSGLPVVGEVWPGYDHVNVQVALDVWLGAEGRSHTLVGLTAWHGHMAVSLGDLRQPGDRGFPRPRIGNVSVAQLPAGPDGQVRSCVRCGLYLVTEAGGTPMVLLCSEGQDHNGGGSTIELEALCGDPARAVSALTELRDLAVRHSVFRGQILTFATEVFGPRRTGALSFQPRPGLQSDDLVLPEGVIEVVERQVLGVARHREQLRRSGQHLKRGLLLYGPPGTGKTHTVRYLLGRLTDVTVLILSGNALSSVGAACSIAGPCSRLRSSSRTST